MALQLPEVLRVAHEALESRGVKHALIGGLAVNAHGYQRLTLDVDFLIEGDQRAAAREALVAAGFTLFHESANGMQFCGPGAVDCLFAAKVESRAMLARAGPTPLQPLPCIGVEGIIALKIQAYKNNPRRFLKELTDIQAIARANPALDLVEVKRYADIFGEWKTIETILSGRSPVL